MSLRRLTNEDRAPAEVAVRDTLAARARSYPGAPHVVTVGRAPNNDVVLSTERIPCLLSRQHAFITLLDAEDGGLLIVDKDTTNGTYVSAGPWGVRHLPLSSPPSLGGIRRPPSTDCSPAPPSGERPQAAARRAAAAA